jgi:hypothetical protein
MFFQGQAGAAVLRQNSASDFSGHQENQKQAFYAETAAGHLHVPLSDKNIIKRENLKMYEKNILI